MIPSITEKCRSKTNQKALSATSAHHVTALNHPLLLFPWFKHPTFSAFSECNRAVGSGPITRDTELRSSVLSKCYNGYSCFGEFHRFHSTSVSKFCSKPVTVVSTTVQHEVGTSVFTPQF
ncbi:hypothetical protein HYC85_012721 [Camellia sinensis]|uniref:Uncharacterized protein n=1 Tax=Camellia sinensis TaxID=4442 RepID=A0A7J7HFN6_CAMSI|nr:hypothetical protein HYC85_012721 [Camellia sinensis]